jgi:uncharacterized protein (TIGR02246 family)
VTTYKADIAAINELYDQYCLGGNTGDLALFISLWADDAIRLEPNTPPIVGKEQIRGRFEAPFEQFDQHVAIHGETEVQVSGDMAFSRGAFTVSIAPKEGGTMTHIEGKWMDILKRQADGAWKIYRNCVILDAPPEA